MFKIVYGIGFIMIFIIRLPYWWLARGTRVVVDRKTVGRSPPRPPVGRDQRVSARLRLHVVAELRRLLASIVDGVDGGRGFRARPLAAVARPRRAGAILVGFGPIAGGTPSSSRTASTDTSGTRCMHSVGCWALPSLVVVELARGRGRSGVVRPDLLPAGAARRADDA